MPSTNAHTSLDGPDTSPPQRHLILGTAGHIDHGKTSLVRALTGVDTDRLPEEQRRGMTIELGFAELPLDGVTFGIVDVPGHERFVRTMVAGATGIDVALIVVAADDSVMPQTVEHVEIVHLLGITSAVVAVTKRDLVESDLVELVAEEMRELLAGTELADSPVLPVSSTTGDGIPQLREVLRAAAENVTPPSTDLPFRMPVDRVFSVAGRGTVVTGSVVTGRAAPHDTVTIWPGGVSARIREVQSHSRSTERVIAGQRAAINLQGVDKSQLNRGSELAAEDAVTPTRWLDAHLHCLASHLQPIRNHTRVRLCLGTREVTARCVLLDTPDLPAGESALVQLRCREPLIAGFGQRFIVRDENAARTAGGGVVLRAAQRRISARMADEIDGLKCLRDGTPAQRIAEVVRYLGWSPPDTERIALATGVARDTVADHLQTLQNAGELTTLDGTRQPLSVRFLEGFERRCTTWLAGYHQRHPDDPGCLRESYLGFLERKSNRTLARAMLDRLIARKAVRALGRYVCLPQFAPALSAEDERVMEQVLELLRAAAHQPPALAELVQQTGATRQRVEKVTKVAVALGELVRVDANIVLHAACAQDMRSLLTELYTASGPFTVSQLRNALNTSRKFAVPLAEYLDRIGFTQRSGDTRTIPDAPTGEANP
jgi:selenocysteine-specific elongation factor